MPRDPTRTKKKFVKLNKITIGETYFEFGEYGSISYEHAKRSGGLEGHHGFKTEQEAMDDVISMHEAWTK